MIEFTQINCTLRKFAGEIGFSLHKEFSGGRRVRFSLHRDARAAESGFYLHKEFPSRLTQGDDATENGDFQRRKQRLQWRKNSIIGRNCLVSDISSSISSYLHKEFPSRQTKGGDVIENFDFPKRKKRLQRYIFLQRSHSTYRKITTLTNCEDVSLTKCQYFLLKTLTTCEDFLEETLTHVKIIYLTH